MPGFPTDQLPLHYVPYADRTDAVRAAIVRGHFEKREPCVVDRFEVTVGRGGVVTRVKIGGWPFLTFLQGFPGLLNLDLLAGTSRERHAILRAFDIEDLTLYGGSFSADNLLRIESPDWMRPGYVPDPLLFPPQPKP